MMRLVLILVCCATSAYGQLAVSGRVISDRSHQPVAGARVALLDSARTVMLAQTTRLDGRFGFTESGQSLLIQASGFNDTLIAAPGLGLVIELREKRDPKGEVVVTASRSVTAIQEVPISTVVVRPAEFTDRAPQGLDNILRNIPGVSVTESQVNIRASSGYARAVGSRVALLFDGMPFLSGDNGDMKFDAIPLLALDRVEVIKGAGSALYGSNAIGGVINLITKEPTVERTSHVALSAGVYDQPKHESWREEEPGRKFYDVDFASSASVSDVGLLGTASFRRNEGYRLGDDLSRWNAFVKATTMIDQTSLKFSGLIANDEHGGWLYWASLERPLFPSDSFTAVVGRTHSRRYNLHGSMSTISGGWLLNSKASYYYTRYETDSLKIDDRLGPRSAAGVFSGEIVASTTPLEALNLTLGSTANLNSVSSNVLSDRTALTVAAFAQGEWKPMPSVTILPGVRMDNITYESESSLNELSPKLGVNWKVDEYFSFRGSIGTGFRAATLTERFIDSRLSGFRVIPNASLEPERSQSAELGALYIDEILRVDIAIFGSTFENLIEPTFAGEDIQFQNIRRAILAGHEELVELRPLATDELLLRLGYTYVYTEDRDTRAELQYRPRHLLQARAEWSPSPFVLSSDFRYISRYHTTDTTLSRIVRDGDARVDAYVLDVRAGVDLKLVLSLPSRLIFQVRNLLNHYYVEIVGNMAPLRSYQLRWETTF